jgi:SagB-type dehydrogenase family enzyme
MDPSAFFRRTELDQASFPAWREAILRAEQTGAAAPGMARSYPGYPRWQLPPCRPRLWPPLDRTLAQRRCAGLLGSRQPGPRRLGRILAAAHGITGIEDRGPVPSAGSLQALELYLAPLGPGWLPPGAYHYDRRGHWLSQVAVTGDRPHWLAMVPSLDLVEGGALLWILIGDGARAQGKYQERGLRFLLLEAGHLMQNLCLACASVRLVTVPLGGYYEGSLAAQLCVPPSDEVLYVGVCGTAEHRPAASREG